MSTRFAQIVLGPAGSGKSTYIKAMAEHYRSIHRVVHCVNMDPAATSLQYDAAVDIREAIDVREAMNCFGFGPNGALVFCLEEVMRDMEWLDDAIGEHDYDYLLVDFPGQIELFSHLDILPRLLKVFEQKGYHLCGVFLLDSQFMIDPSKFLSGALVALSAMTMFGIPHINLLSKGDLLTEEQKDDLEPYVTMYTDVITSVFPEGSRLRKLTASICELIDRFNLVQFDILNIKDNEVMQQVSAQIDMILQYYDNADMGDEEFDAPLPEEQPEYN